MASAKCLWRVPTNAPPLRTQEFQPPASLTVGYPDRHFPHANPQPHPCMHGIDTAIASGRTTAFNTSLAHTASSRPARRNDLAYPVDNAV